MKFQRFSFYLSKLEATPSRNKITELFSSLLAEADAGEVDKICYLSLGRLAPLYSGLEFNLAEKLLLKVLARTFQKEETEVRKKYKEMGDMGDVVAFYKDSKKGKTLSVNEVYDRLYDLANYTGEGSVERKIAAMSNLLTDLDSLSGKYVARIPIGKLRLGFSELTILDALSFLITGDKSKRSEIENAFNKRADIGQLAVLVKTQGLSSLKKIKVTLGIPLMPALAQRLPSADEMIKKMGKVAVEPKFDGTRLQIHFSRKKTWRPDKTQLAFDFNPKGFVQTFTRNLENTTNMFPDLVQIIFKEIKADEVILDSEAIGYNPKTGKFLPFQETMQRKRKYSIKAKSKEIPLKFFCFDIMYKDGEDLISLPFTKRRESLERILSSKNSSILLTPQIITDNPAVLRRLVCQARLRACHLLEA